MAETPRETLDRVLAFEPGMGVPIKFDNPVQRDLFRQKLFSAMASDVRSSKTQNDAASHEWGTHRWAEVQISIADDLTLWIGRQAEFEIGTEPMTLAEARGAERSEK